MLRSHETAVGDVRKEMQRVADEAAKLLRFHLPTTPLSSRARAFAHRVILSSNARVARQAIVQAQQELYEQCTSIARAILDDTQRECEIALGGLERTFKVDMISAMPAIRHSLVPFEPMLPATTTELYEKFRGFGFGTRLSRMLLPRAIAHSALGGASMPALTVAGGFAGLRSLKRSKIAATRHELLSMAVNLMQIFLAGALEDLQVFQRNTDALLKNNWVRYAAGLFSKIEARLGEIATERERWNRCLAEADKILDQATLAAHTLLTCNLHNESRKDFR